MQVIETVSPKETQLLGKKLGEIARAGQIYALTGDLGTGKTVLAQGFAKGLGIKENVNSPTFTILQEYSGGRLPLYHFDVYRILDVYDMEEIGYEDYFFGKGVCLIEWGEVIEEILPVDTIRIQIRKDPEKGPDYRRITLKGLDEEIKL